MDDDAPGGALESRRRQPQEWPERRFTYERRNGKLLITEILRYDGSDYSHEDLMGPKADSAEFVGGFVHLGSPPLFHVSFGSPSTRGPRDEVEEALVLDAIARRMHDLGFTERVFELGELR